MTTEEIAKFELEQFYDVLMSVNIKQKLKPFVRQFKKKNIPFIYQTIVNLIQVITSKKDAPLMHFNALMATKLFFDTGEYTPIMLIEVYLLPIVFEIAAYRIQKRSEEGLTLYFIERGYDATKEMKRIGFNYVLLAIEFIFMAALIKPYRTLQNDELKQQSNYAKVSKVLRQRGVQPIENYKFYIPSYINQTRKRFMKKLSRFNPEQYSDFFLKLVCDEMNMNKKPEIDLKKLYVYGDAFFTIPLMHVCEDELTNMETNFVNKKKYLNLLGDFMKLGDIYAVLIITRSTFLETIFEKIQKIKGDKGLEAGEQIYPEIQAAKTDKKQFYIEYLKYIQLWANCHPVDQDNQPTDAKKIFDILKTQKKFVFPSNILMNKIKGQMQVNLKLNQKRNEKMIKMVDEHSSYDSRKKMNSSNRDSKMSKRSSKIKSNSYIEFDQLEQMVLNAKKQLNLIIVKQKLAENIKALQKFKIFWEVNAQKNEIDADQSCDIEIVLQEGQLCVKIIQIVLPVYSQYSKGLISFEQYKDRVQLLINKQADPKGQTSFQNDLPKEEQQSISVQQFQETYEKQSLSNLHSNSELKKLKSKQPQRSDLEQSKNNQQSKLTSKISSNNSNIKNAKSRQREHMKQNISQSHIEDNHSNDGSKIEESNVSFKESYQSSHFRQKSKKQSMVEQERSNLQPSAISQSQNQSSIAQNQQIRRNLNESSASKRSSRSNRKLLQRRDQQLKKGSNISKQTQSKYEKQQTMQYRDAINANKSQNDYQQNRSERDNQSFISSSSSSVKISDSQKNSKLKLKLHNKTELQSVKIDQQSQIYQENAMIKAKERYYQTNRANNEDYYGINQDQVFKNKNSQVSYQSRQSSKRGKHGDRSRSKESSIKREFIKRKQQINDDSFQNRDYQNFQSQKSSKIKSFDKNNINNKANQSQIQSKINESQIVNQQSKIRQNPSSIIMNNGLLSNISRYDEDSSKIMEPDQNPMLHSFHEFNDFQSSNPSKIGSFRDCFEVNNQIILSKESSQKLLRFSKSGKIVNFIQTAYAKQTPKSSSIVDILSERNAKNSIQNYRNQRQKYRQSQTLSEKVKSLQSFNKNMRMKVVVNKQLANSKDKNQLKYSAVNGSEPASFTNGSQISKQRSDVGFNINYTQTKREIDLDQSRLINNNIYTHYFPQHKSDKTKKSMLKAKSLIFKSDEFEIGCVSNRRDKYIDISFFLTPMKDKIEDITLTLFHDQNITMKINSEWIQIIKANQQEHISMQCSIQNVPYVVPTLSFKFRTNPKYTHNHILIPVPCSFNKFITYHPISEEYISQFQNYNQDLISTEQFKFNTKLINQERVKQSLNNFAFIRAEKNYSYFGCQAYFKGKIFLLKFGISEKGIMQLEGKNMTGDHKNIKFLQFLLITFREIFQQGKKSK